MKPSSPKLFLTAIFLMLLLLSAYSTRAQAFANNQSGSLAIGQKDLFTRGNVASQRGFTVPGSSVFDSSGNLWVADTGNNRILEFQPPFTFWENASVVLGHQDFTTKTSTSGPSTLASPSGVAFDSSGNLWVADSSNNRVVEFAPPFANGEVPSLIIGQKTLSLNQTQTRTVNQSVLTHPEALTFNSGNLWVADSGDSRVLEFAPPFTNGMGAILVIGQSNFIRAAPRAPTNASNIQGPSSVVFDSSGNLWISDFVNYRVLQFKAPFSNGESASLVLGQSNLNARVIAVTRSNLQNPRGLAFDSAGSLWVADTQDQRVLRFDSPFASGMNAALVLGQPGFTTRSANVSASAFANPSGVVFDSSGNLWVTDTVNSRVIEFTSTAVPEFPMASLAIITLASLAVVAVVSRRFLSLRQPLHQ